MNPDDVIYNGKYIWHRQKNERNILEHRIRFEEAVDVFDDPFSVEEYDIDNSAHEDSSNGYYDSAWRIDQSNFRTGCGFRRTGGL